MIGAHQFLISPFLFFHKRQEFTTAITKPMTMKQTNAKNIPVPKFTLLKNLATAPATAYPPAPFEALYSRTQLHGIKLNENKTMCE